MSGYPAGVMYVPEHFHEDFLAYIQKLAVKTASQMKGDVPPSMRVIIIDRLYKREACLKQSIINRLDELRSLVLWDWKRASRLNARDVKRINNLCEDIDALHDEARYTVQFRCNMEMLQLGIPRCDRRNPDFSRKPARMDEFYIEDEVFREKRREFRELISSARRIFQRALLESNGALTNAIPAEDLGEYLRMLIGPRPRMEQRPLLTWKGATVNKEVESEYLDSISPVDLPEEEETPMSKGSPFSRPGTPNSSSGGKMRKL